MSGPCAKTTVVCTLIMADGVHKVVGRNGCENPQPVCPRAPGEDYAKCKSICQQVGHAEIVALDGARELGLQIHGAHAYVEGNTYACRNCQEALFAAGVTSLTIGPPPAAWVRTPRQQIHDLHVSNNELLERARRAEARAREFENGLQRAEEFAGLMRKASDAAAASFGLTLQRTLG